MSNKPTLLIFVHGFLGSEQSFHTFPKDIEQKSKRQIRYIIYPKYDTKGNNGVQVQQLVKWLLLNATTVDYSEVILLAHSMGGLLVVDAYKSLYSANQSDLKLLVNIVGIITYDSPFFGLKPSVITSLSQDSINNIASSHLSNLSWMDSAGLFNWKVGMVAGGAALASGALCYYTGGMATTLTSAVTGMAIKAAEHARHHLEFLYPLINSDQEMKSRFSYLQSEIDNDSLFFKGFYLLLHPKKEVIIPITQSPNRSAEKTTFCIPPPTEFSKLFIEISSMYEDQVLAHMSIFKQENETHYEHVLYLTTEFIDLNLNLRDKSK